MTSPDNITEEESRLVLDKFFSSKGSEDAYEFKAFKIKNFHNPWQGLVGEHFILTIHYHGAGDSETKEVDFFVKTLSSNALMKEFSKTLQVYEKEAFFFSLQDKYPEYDIDTSFAPKGYFFRPYITVLEDLSKHYKGTPKRTLLDLEHCQSCLEAIARFHASSIIYEKRKEKELNGKFTLKDSQILEDKFECKEDNIVTRWMVGSLEGLTRLIELLPKSHVPEKDFTEKLLEVVSAGSEDGLVFGVLHGDLWSSNFLHRYDSGKVVETKLIDYQLIKYGPLEQDVVEFLVTSGSVDLEDKFDSLVKHYYEILKKVVSAAGLDCDKILPSSNKFVNSCRNFQVAGRVHAAIDHSYTFLQDEVYAEALKTDESWQKFLFEDRGKYLAESYNKDQIFRDRICEDLIKLRDLLFP